MIKLTFCMDLAMADIFINALCLYYYPGVSYIYQIVFEKLESDKEWFERFATESRQARQENRNCLRGCIKSPSQGHSEPVSESQAIDNEILN